jgi:hypothetical protein
VADEKVATYIALAITVVWVLSVALDAVWPPYDPPATVHALMMAVAGWAFGQQYIGNRRIKAEREREAKDE